MFLLFASMSVVRDEDQLEREDDPVLFDSKKRKKNFSSKVRTADQDISLSGMSESVGV